MATVKLLDKATGQLFAACPLPHDKPMVTAVEAVVDSSRSVWSSGCTATPKSGWSRGWANWETGANRKR